MKHKYYNVISIATLIITTCNLIMAATNFFDYISSGYTICYGIKSLTYLGFAIIMLLSKVLVTVVQCYKDIIDTLDENDIDFSRMYKLELLRLRLDSSISSIREELGLKRKENNNGS